MLSTISLYGLHIIKRCRCSCRLIWVCEHNMNWHVKCEEYQAVSITTSASLANPSRMAYTLLIGPVWWYLQGRTQLHGISDIRHIASTLNTTLSKCCHEFDQKRTYVLGTTASNYNWIQQPLYYWTMFAATCFTITHELQVFKHDGFLPASLPVTTPVVSQMVHVEVVGPRGTRPGLNLLSEINSFV